MNQQLINTIILAASFLALFALAEFLFHIVRVQAEYTRKMVHAGTGVLTLLFPVMLHNKYFVLLLCLSFAGILFISLRYNLLKSINSIGRASHGSISYPAAIFGSYLFYEWCNTSMASGYIAFYLPVIILAISDPVAALTGRRWPIGRYKVGSEHKSMMGSFAFFISAFLICFLLIVIFCPSCPAINSLLFSALTGAAGALAEGVSRNGLDNLSIPFAVCLVFYLMFNAFIIS